MARHGYGAQVMDSYRSSGSIRSELEGLGIRSRPIPGYTQKRVTSTIGNDNRGGEMTTIKMFILSGLIAIAAHAVIPEIAVEEPQTIIVNEQVN